MSSTKYIILRNGKEGWNNVGIVQAASSTAALREHIRVEDANGESGGEYVVVPARSFKPVTVKIERAVKIA
jgi:hypothetical protein